MLSARLVGRRIVLRYRRSDGILPPLSDVVGELVSLTPTTAIVAGPNGPVTVDRAAIAAARAVAPHRRQILELERIARRGWRAAEVVELDGWLLHADAGWTSRANSALPLVTPPRPLTELLGAAQEFYAERGLPVQIQLPLPARGLLDAELAGRCWRAHRPAVVLTAPVTSPAEAHDGEAHDGETHDGKAHDGEAHDGETHDGDERVRLDPVASSDWLENYHTRGPLSGDAVRLLNRHDQVRFASLSRDGTVVGVARGTVDEGWLGVTAVEVAAAHRRSGVASALMRALQGWGSRQGATRCYLQVDAANSEALAFYQRLGFIEHHRYHYRIPPATS